MLRGPGFDTLTDGMTFDHQAFRHRLATRVLALLVLLALAWPAVGLCLPGAPSAMPCCVKREAGAPPTMRACCGQTPANSATSGSSLASAITAPQQSAAFLFVLAPSSRSIPIALAPRPARAEIRLLNSVFLI